MSTLLYTLGVFNTHTVIATMVMLASYESSQHCAGVMTFPVEPDPGLPQNSASSTGFANGHCKCTNAVSSACMAQETTPPCLPSFPLPHSLSPNLSPPTRWTTNRNGVSSSTVMAISSLSKHHSQAPSLFPSTLGERSSISSLESLTFLNLEGFLDMEVTVDEIEHYIKTMKLGRSGALTHLTLSIYAMGVES